MHCLFPTVVTISNARILEQVLRTSGSLLNMTIHLKCCIQVYTELDPTRNFETDLKHHSTDGIQKRTTNG